MSTLRYVLWLQLRICCVHFFVDLLSCQCSGHAFGEKEGHLKQLHEELKHSQKTCAPIGIEVSDTRMISEYEKNRESWKIPFYMYAEKDGVPFGSYLRQVEQR